MNNAPRIGCTNKSAKRNYERIIVPHKVFSLVLMCSRYNIINILRIISDYKFREITVVNNVELDLSKNKSDIAKSIIDIGTLNSLVHFELILKLK